MSHEIARNWRLKKQRYNLVGEICNDGHYVFPPRDICPDCGNEAKTLHEFSGKGEVYSSTIIYEAPKGFEGSVPYEVALIKLVEGPMLTAQITDKDDPNVPIAIGTPVEMVTRKLNDNSDSTGIINYGYKFRERIESISS